MHQVQCVQFGEPIAEFHLGPPVQTRTHFTRHTSQETTVQRLLEALDNLFLGDASFHDDIQLVDQVESIWASSDRGRLIGYSWNKCMESHMFLVFGHECKACSCNSPLDASTRLTASPRLIVAWISLKDLQLAAKGFDKQNHK